MKSESWTNIAAPLVKVGNSFCVRIPVGVVRKNDLHEGELLAVKLKRMEVLWSEEMLRLWLDVARKQKALDSFSDDKIILLSRLAFNEGKILLDSVNRDRKETALKWSSYRESIRKEFGRRIYEEFLMFRKVMDAKLAEMEACGTQ